MGWIALALAFVSLAAIVSDKVAREERTRVKVARYYLNSSFVLCVLGILSGIYLFVVLTKMLSKVNDRLVDLKNNQCFNLVGANLALGRVTDFNSETEGLFRPKFTWILLISLAYLGVWIYIFRKSRSAQN